MLWFVFFRSDLLLRRTETGQYAVPSGEEPPVNIPVGQTVHNIAPTKDGTHVKTFRIDEKAKIPDGHELTGLRRSYDLISRELYVKAGKCEEILHWDEHTRFCGVCGAPMTLHTDISKRCTVCGEEVWAQVSPAVIVLVRREEEVLMVKAHNFPGDFFGLVAGFVETGETLEEACAREVREETGIEITNIRYVFSQEWPYPSVVMAAFTADYVSGEIVLQESELAAGGWFTRDNLPALPSPVGVAYRMIDAWLSGKI